nr:unnamed protein product [Amyelois transitella]
MFTARPRGRAVLSPPPPLRADGSAEGRHLTHVAPHNRAEHRGSKTCRNLKMDFDVEKFISEIQRYTKSITVMQIGKGTPRGQVSETIYFFITGRSLQIKWKNLRDAFMKECRRQKNIKSGAGAKKNNQYRFYNQLLFLKPYAGKNKTQNSLSAGDDESVGEGNESVRGPYEDRALGTKRKKSDPAEEMTRELIDTLKTSINKKENEEDPDRQFMLSLPGLSPRQYGFMPQRSTEDFLYALVNKIRSKLVEKKLITVVSLDIEGAFDNAWWPKIRVRLAEECPVNVRRLVDDYLRDRKVAVRYGGEEAMAETSKGCIQGSIAGPLMWNLLLDPLLKELDNKGVYYQAFADDIVLVDDYLRDRKVAVRYGGEEAMAETSKGCIQGSIAGPLMWNLLLDPLLKELDNKGVYYQAFADDIVLVFEGQTAREIEVVANRTLSRVEEWGAENKLKFAAHKTNAMTITNKLKFDTPRLNMSGIPVAETNKIKILGLTIDSKLTFNEHIRNVCNKSLVIYKQLAKAAKTSWGLNPEIVRLIYTASVEPIILYAASAWAPAAEKIGAQKQLNAVQRGFAQKIYRAYRTVSLNSALVLSGLLPLDLRIREAASLYKIKKGAPLPELPGREIERPAPAMEAPHPAEHIDLDFVCLEDQGQVDSSSDFDVRIYTDGSKIDGRVGAALSIWKGQAETRSVKLSLPSYCSVYQAELLAICEAVRRILECRAESTFGIYSDSMSALQTVANPFSRHPLVVNIRANIKDIRDHNKIVKLFWVKAHAGLEGNERADVLAKEAAVGSKRRQDYDLFPISYAKRVLREDTLGIWEKRYNDGETAAITKLFFPSAVEAYGTVRRIVWESPITQALTGHGGFSEYLHRFKCKGDPSCACEPGVPEDIVHLLTKCPIYGRLRHDTETRLDMKIDTSNFKNLLTDKDKRDLFLTYCKEIRVLREDTLGIWEKRYNDGETAAITKLFFPSAVEAYGTYAEWKYERNTCENWLTLDEIAEVLDNWDDPGDIILFPPEDGTVTDEDSEDENEANILRLPSRMLRSHVKLQERPSTSGENPSHNLEEGEEIDLPAPKKKQKKDNTIKNDSTPPNDKFAKDREYFTKLNGNFVANFKRAAISIDETIVPYFGRHGTKQHIHGKPIRFGYKLWSAATRHGYLVSCELYQGNSPDMNPIENMWELTKRAIAKEVITTKQQLIESLIREWHHNPKLQENAKTCIESMPRRIEALIAAKGGITKY